MPSITRIFPWGQDVLETAVPVCLRAGVLYIAGGRRQRLQDSLAVPERKGNFMVRLRFANEDCDITFENSRRAERFWLECTAIVARTSLGECATCAATPQRSNSVTLDSSPIKARRLAGPCKRQAKAANHAESCDRAPLETSPSKAETLQLAKHCLQIASAKEARRDNTATARAMPTAGQQRDLEANALADRLAVPVSTCSPTSYENICERWKIGETLSKGTFSEVHLARNTTSQVVEVLKFVRKEAFSQFQSKKESSLSLGSEAALLSHLDHPNIVRLLCCFQTNESICLVMEYIRGGTLLDSLIKSGRFAEQHARPLFYDICTALAYIHWLGIAHRDIKCDNVLLTTQERGASLRAKLADFGLSRSALQSHDCRTFCGTYLHMAPEVFQCRLPVKVGYGRQADMYALGVLLYIVLCGNVPGVSHAGGDTDESDADLDALSFSSRALVNNLRAIDPKDRPTAKQALKCEWLCPGVSELAQPAAKRRRADQSSEAAQPLTKSWVVENVSDLQLTTPSSIV